MQRTTTLPPNISLSEEDAVAGTDKHWLFDVLKDLLTFHFAGTSNHFND